jgi:hypothetical protein
MQCGDLREISRAGGTQPKRPFRRAVGDLSLLQHGSGGRAGINALPEARQSQRRRRKQ